MIKARDKKLVKDSESSANDRSDELLQLAENAPTFQMQARYIMAYLKEKGDDWYSPDRYPGMYLRHTHHQESENTLSKLFEED